MAEHVKSATLEYRPAASLVLNAAGPRPRVNEPTGEAESLAKHLTGSRMGDRVARARPAELDERLKKARERRAKTGGAGDEEEAATRRAARAARGVSGAGGQRDLFDGLNYRPRTKETRDVYERLLTFAQRCLGDQPQEVLAGAVDEVLPLLKAEDSDASKKSRVAGLLGPLDDYAFSQLIALGKGVTDWESSGASGGGGGAGGDLDQTSGVAVILDDEEEEGGDDNDVDEIREEGDDDEALYAGDGEEADGGAGLAAEGGANGATASSSSAAGEADEAAEEAAGLVPVSKIDAFWLQRALSAHYPDALEAAKMADAVMSVLATCVGPERVDPRQAENDLVNLLDFDKFDLVKTLLRNAARVYYLTRLRQAQTDAERTAVAGEMVADRACGGPAILAAATAVLSSTGWAADRTQSVSDRLKREAAELGKRSAAAAAAEAAAGGADAEARLLLASRVAGGGDAAALAAAAAAATAAASAPGAKPSEVLDLDRLAFAEGGHLMANRKVTLPEGSWRAQKKGYEEVHVPALKARPYAPGERQIPITELPPWAQPGFKGMTKLNRVQSRLYETALFSAENMLLCAPTGAGKTNVAMLTILHELGLHRRPDGSFDLDAFKIVYVAPMKALVQEIVQNFTQRLTEAFGIQVRELSGDVSLTKAEIAATQIIVTTPEKWDVITRKAGDRTYTQLVRLLILDEVHLLHDERGAVLEALVARTLRHVEASQEMVRIVGLSATLPNYQDVAVFLRVDPDRGLFYFDNSYRPCPLQQTYIGITEKKALKRLALLNEICYEKVDEHAGRNQILVFVHARKETGKTARALRDAAKAADALGKYVKPDSASREVLATEAEATARDAELKDLLPYGFGIHHAGMARSDRTLVEELFADGHIQVLVCTATLAWGVNLPAHTVIIKGTQVYNPEKGRWTELSSLDMMQMLGRAGRPQYDTYGEGIIITGHGELQFYLSLLNQQLPIESQLMAKLADQLNAEVVLGSVTNIREAAAWLGYTYLYVRLLKNPGLYGASEADAARDPAQLQRRLDLVHSAALLLAKHALVVYDRRTGALQATPLGRVASHYYVSHASIATYNEHLKPTLGDIELFRLFSLSNEFRNVIVRQEEKEELRKLLERVPVPIKEAVDEPAAKVNVLLQAYISNLKLDGLALVSDMVYVQQSAGRLMRALFEICMRRGWAPLALRALAAAKMVDHRQWLSASPLRQFTPAQGGLGEEALRRLEKKDLPWERYHDLSPADLGELVRAPKLGKAIHRLVHCIPRLELRAQVQPVTRSLLRIDLTITPDFAVDAKVHGGTEMFWVLVEDADGEVLLHHEPFALKLRYIEDEATITLHVPVTDPRPPQYFIRLVSDRWLYSEALLPLSLRNLALPEKFPPHTELLDLAPVPVAALEVPEYVALYSPTSGAGAAEAALDAATRRASRFTHFNPIQTQAFHALYESDENVLLAAPSGSGKTVCAELAILRAFAKDPDARVVYLAPRPEAVRLRYEAWEARFGGGLGKAVVELTGELASDLKLVDRGHVILSTPRAWDAVSRRWKKRRAVQEVALFIADDLEAIGADPYDAATAPLAASGGAGPAYEVVVSRARFLAFQQAQQGLPPTRLLGLSLSVANARDLAEWLGAPATGIFNFHPQVRPVPLEIRLQGFDVPSFGARLLAMARPAYSAAAAVASTPGKPALIFVPSRKQAQMTAVDLIMYAAADGAPDRFRKGRATSEYLTGALAAIGSKDAALASCMAQGVAFYHDAMRPADKELVESLYAAGALGVVVAPASSAWSMDATAWGAALVVIMGTEAYDGRSHSYVEYPLSDVLRLMGRAARLGQDELGRVSVLCSGPRKEYLKRFLYEPMPVESHLHRGWHDHLNAEVVNGIVASKQDALDYLTWTFLYRRLGQNPNFYNLAGTGAAFLSDYLSELVDATLSDLEAAQCVTIANDTDVAPSNLGMIAAYYYAAYTSLEVFATSLTAKTKTKGLLEILANASEYDTVPLRHGDEATLRTLAAHAVLAMPPPPAGKSPAAAYSDPHSKAYILLQTHFSRTGVAPELRVDRERIVEVAVPLLQAMVDVASSQGWLKPTLAVMELSQMIVQGLWANVPESVFMQLPHVSKELASKLLATSLEGTPLTPEEAAEGGAGLASVYDLMGMEEGARAAALGGLPAPALADIAAFCNRYPSIEVGYDLVGGVGASADAPSSAGEGLTLAVTLTRDEATEGLDEGAGLGSVHAPAFPKPKSEGWWLVLGDPKANALLAVKRLAVGKRAAAKLDFPAPETPGVYSYKLYFMCDSYLGCDQEYDVKVHVA